MSKMLLGRPRGQMSESMLTAAFIILSGGLQDAYTYLCRGKVFANAQTGNIVLFSAYLFDGDWTHSRRYLVPVLSFMLGIFVAECIHRHFKHMERVHWRQLILLAEIVLLFLVGFLPQEGNTAANALVSFVCAMQVQTFRKVRGHAYASTMCIGNMRSGTEALCVYFHTRDREVLHKALTYFGVIGLFAVGAGLGALLTRAFAERGIWVSCALLAAVSVVLARFIIPMPNETTRFSLEAVPIFLAGMLFGPLPGALVGFVSDFVGCLFSGYGYNPMFCVPPILYGLAAGLFQPMLVKKTSVWTIALAFLPAITLGSILWQSFALAFVYGGDAKTAFFLTKLASRSIQFGVTFVIDVAVVWLLYRSKVFTAAKLWPPVKYEKKSET